MLALSGSEVMYGQCVINTLYVMMSFSLSVGNPESPLERGDLQSSDDNETQSGRSTSDLGEDYLPENDNEVRL